MVIHTELKRASVDDLYLDPQNPRLGRSNTIKNLEQGQILALMNDYTIDELAVSFLESGFWVHEALLVVKQNLYGEERLVVVEGNRRLAALKYLQIAFEGGTVPGGKGVTRKWTRIVSGKEIPPGLFESVPYVLMDSKDDVKAFLGFRHVTGIKEWDPPEKAEFIARLIDEDGMTYEQVMRKIGSKTPTVRQNYISYKVLLQMEDLEQLPVERVEERFSVLYLSLRTRGVQSYLNIDIQAEPAAARRPVPADKLEALTKFALWLFGSDKESPLIADSRQVDEFGTILESPEAVAYLERTEKPIFENALRIAGGDEPELVRQIEAAAESIVWVLGRVHRYKESEKLRRVIERFGEDALQLLRVFPNRHQSMFQDGE